MTAWQWRVIIALIRTVLRLVSSHEDNVYTPMNATDISFLKEAVGRNDKDEEMMG